MRGYGDQERSFHETAYLFNDTLPNRPPIPKSIVLKTVYCFEETGATKDCEKCGKAQSATNTNKYFYVLQTFIEESKSSLRDATLYYEINCYSVFYKN